jgi:transcriptional regulator with XRE-family HTH domain
MSAEFGNILRYWRNLRGFSQLHLALQANVSSKHISFLENGRAQPSRDMVILLSAAMDIPFVERNVLLNAAGFSDLYTCMNIHHPQMAPVKQALNFMLTQHEPYPAFVLDEEWNILMSNNIAQKILLWMQRLHPGFPETTNLMEITFAREGLRRFINNWQEVACFLLRRIKKQSLVDGDDQLLQRLLKLPDIPHNWEQLSLATPNIPMLSLDITIEEYHLSIFSSLASFGTAVDITMKSMIIEQYFPADDKTRVFFETQNVLENF